MIRSLVTDDILFLLFTWKSTTEGFSINEDNKAMLDSLFAHEVDGVQVDDEDGIGLDQQAVVRNHLNAHLQLHQRHFKGDKSEAAHKMASFLKLAQHSPSLLVYSALKVCSSEHATGSDALCALTGDKSNGCDACA